LFFNNDLPGISDLRKGWQSNFGARGRKAVEARSVYQLRESQVSYPADLGLENDDIGVNRAKNIVVNN
jgi:hypothetical protein